MPTDNSKGNPTLLLVEDSEDDAFLFERAFEHSGLNCAIRRVANGMQAVQYLQPLLRSGTENLPRVIFLDLKMPVMNGFEVLAWMRTQTFSPEIKVIVLSGSDYHADKTRAAQMGAADYLVKPVEPDDLHRLLADVCGVNPNIGAPH